MTSSINPILLVSGVRGDTRRYRLFHPREQLQLLGIPVELAHISDPGLTSLLGRASLVLFQRVSMNRWVERSILDLTRRGIPVLTDVDDLVFDPTAFQYIDSPDFADSIRAKLYQEEMRRNRQTLQASAAVLASTEYLASQVRLLGRPAHVLRNAFSLELLELSLAAQKDSRAMLLASQIETNQPRVVIGYASGTLTHNKDFSLIRPALTAVMDRFPQVELWLIGPLDPGNDWGGLADRIHRLPLVPWRDLPAIQAQFDINLAPLRTDNPFGQSKSELKFIEAALTARPTVASSSDAFGYAIRHGENGFLARTTEDWAACLSILIEQPQFRQEMGENAYRDVLKKYHPLQRAGELRTILAEYLPALKSAQNIPLSPENLPRSDPKMETSPSLLQIGLYNLRSRGILILAMQIWVFIRRLLAPVFPYRRNEID